MSALEFLSNRLTGLPDSVLHAVHREVETARRAGREVLRLHVGEPAFRAPVAVSEAVARAVREGRTDYTSAEGLPILRERLSERLQRCNGVDAKPGRVLVTPGSSHALITVMMAMCAPGDEVLIPEIHWPIYAQGAAVARLRVTTYRLRPDHTIDADGFASSITPATRIAVVNSPANPTGALCDAAILANVLDAARRSDIWLIGDEAYEHFVYEGCHVALASLESDVPVAERRVFSVHTFSKGYGMTGYRMGYVAAPSEQTATALRRVSEGTIIAPSTPAQYGALAALDDEEMPVRANAHVRSTRDASLADAGRDGLIGALPPAGWYALLDSSTTGLGSTAFAQQLLAEQQVAVTPGNAFMSPSSPDPHCVRVAFCGDRAMTVEGVRRIRGFVAERRALQPLSRANLPPKGS